MSSVQSAPGRLWGIFFVVADSCLWQEKTIWKGIEEASADHFVSGDPSPKVFVWRIQGLEKVLTPSVAPASVGESGALEAWEASNPSRVCGFVCT